MTMVLRRLAATALPVVAPVAEIAAYLAVRSRLPDPLPVHWDLHGEVNNTAGTTAFITVTMIVSAALAVVAGLAIWFAHSPLAGRMLSALLTFGAWVCGGIAVSTVLLSDGAGQAADVAMPWFVVVGAIVVPAAAAIAVGALLPGGWQHPAAPHPTPESPLTFAPGESVVWLDHVHSSMLRWVGVLAALIGVVMLYVAPSVAIPLLIGAVVLVPVSDLAVRIDRRGVHTLWGPFGWPRSRIRLDEVVEARATEIIPMEWGGWGYRISSRGVAAVIRRGPGLVIERRDKPTYAVTVPHAQDGADVLNALLSRERAAPPDQ